MLKTAVVTKRVMKLRDRCKPPVSDNIYDDILKLLAEKVEKGKVSTLTKVSDDVRRYWKIHCKEFVDVVDVEEHVGEKAKGILLQNGRILLSQSLSMRLVGRYVDVHGKQAQRTIRKDLQSVFELAFPFLQEQVRKKLNVKAVENRKWIKQKVQDRMIEVYKQAQSEIAINSQSSSVQGCTEEIGSNDINKFHTKRTQVQSKTDLKAEKSVTFVKLINDAEHAEVTASVPSVMLIQPTPKRKAKPKTVNPFQQGMSSKENVVYSNFPLHPVASYIPWQLTIHRLGVQK